jgi:hypothetical protein
MKTGPLEQLNFTRELPRSTFGDLDRGGRRIVTGVRYISMWPSGRAEPPRAVGRRS